MAYGYWYNQSGLGGLATAMQGMGDVLPRGAKIHWEGDVTGWSSGIGYTPGAQQQLYNLLINAGFQAELNDQKYWASWNDWRVIVDAVTPIDYGNAEDAFSVIKGFVWQAYQQEPRNISQQVLNVPQINAATGQPAYVGAPNYQPVGDAGACSNKQGLDWVSCQLGLDTTAQKLGLGVGAGVTLALVGLLVVGLVVLKK